VQQLHQHEHQCLAIILGIRHFLLEGCNKGLQLLEVLIVLQSKCTAEYRDKSTYAAISRATAATASDEFVQCAAAYPVIFRMNLTTFDRLR